MSEKSEKEKVSMLLNKAIRAYGIRNPRREKVDIIVKDTDIDIDEIIDEEIKVIEKIGYLIANKKISGLS